MVRHSQSCHFRHRWSPRQGHSPLRGQEGQHQEGPLGPSVPAGPGWTDEAPPPGDGGCAPPVGRGGDIHGYSLRLHKIFEVHVTSMAMFQLTYADLQTSSLPYLGLARITLPSLPHPSLPYLGLVRVTLPSLPHPSLPYLGLVRVTPPLPPSPTLVWSGSPPLPPTPLPPLPWSGQGHSSPAGCHRSSTPWLPDRRWRTAARSAAPGGSHRRWTPWCSCCGHPSPSTSPHDRYPPEDGGRSQSEE